MLVYMLLYVYATVCNVILCLVIQLCEKHSFQVDLHYLSKVLIIHQRYVLFSLFLYKSFNKEGNCLLAVVIEIT